MKKALISLLLLISSCWVNGLLPELVLENDDRKALPVASFGFLAGGQLTIDLRDFHLSDPQDPGVVAFYIRKGRQSIIEEAGGVSRDESPKDNDDDERSQIRACFLDYSYVKDEVDDGSSLIKEIPINEQTWQTSMTVGPTEEGLWQVLFINCKQHSTVSFRLSMEQVNPDNNHLSAGDTPLPLVYGVSAMAYLLVSLYWLRLLSLRKDTRVFRAHWFMLILVVCLFVNKALQSAKFYYTKIGVLTEGWRIGFYVFASLKGLLSILIIVLLASGWMFIKPFLSTKDKRVISVVIPLQVLANIASAVSNEAALGSTDKSFWTTLLPLIDLAGCAVILWTILQTRKHLGTASAADGKEVDILNKYKLWSAFYIVTLVYIYVTRIIVQLLQASLSFRYVTWLGEAVDEVATLLFYIFIGYKFRPFPNNPYTQVPDEDLDEENDATYRSGTDAEDTLRMYPISRARNNSDKTTNPSTDSL